MRAKEVLAAADGPDIDGRIGRRHADERARLGAQLLAELTEESAELLESADKALIEWTRERSSRKPNSRATATRSS